MISEEDIQDHINKSMIEQCILNAENELLYYLKIRQETFPNEKIMRKV
jgi:hypothetical protein